MKKIFLTGYICLFGFVCLNADEQTVINKYNQVQKEETAFIKKETANRQTEMEISQTSVSNQEPLSLIQKQILPEKEVSVQEVKPAEQVSKEPQPIQSKEIKDKEKDPEGVAWRQLIKGKLDIKMQKRTSGIPTPNLSMKFNQVYQSLFKNIPWLMGGTAKVYVYQDRNNFLSHEAVASNWSGAFFSPEHNRIVMYDEPDRVKPMLSQFQHELTHLFVDHFFSPQGSNKPEAPVWLNEGLAVNMEDITNNYQGDIWAKDLIVLNLLPSGKGPAANLKAPSPVCDTTIRFIRFTDFIKDSSYDDAVAAGKVEDWYMQAYSMVRFLFKPYNNQYPQKRIQFEQLTKLLNTYQNKKDITGKLVKDNHGRQIKTRISLARALKQAYGFRSINDFEMKFWQWLYPYQKEQRTNLGYY